MGEEGGGISLRDSVISGNASVTSSNTERASISLQDSAIAGDVTIVQNTLDSNELIQKLKHELTQFKSGGVGFRIPEGGFSRQDIEALIPQLQRDPSPLRELPSTQLIEFGRLLRAMAQPKLLAVISSQLLGRDDVKSSPEQHAASHLIRSDAESAVLRTKSALNHAKNAFEIAHENGFIEIASCALHTCIRCCKELALDRTSFVEQTEAYLEKYGQAHDLTAAWLHLALGEHHDTARPGLADHHESMGLDRARKAGDLEAQILALVLSADNSHWVIREHIWEDLRKSSDTYGLRFYSMLINLADFVRHGEYERLLAGIRNVQKISRESGLVELEVMGSLMQLTQGIHHIIEDTSAPSAQKASLIRELMRQQHITEAMDAVLTEGYLGLDEELVFFFGLLAFNNQTLPGQCKAYLNLPRESTTVSIRSMLMLLSGINENGTFDQRILRDVKKTLIDKEITIEQPVWRLYELAAKGKREQTVTVQQREQFVNRNPIPADYGRFIYWFVTVIWMVEIGDFMHYWDFSLAQIMADDEEAFIGFTLPLIFIAAYTMRSLRSSKITALRRTQQNRPNPIPYPYHETTVGEGMEIINIFVHWVCSLVLTFVFMGAFWDGGSDFILIEFALFVMITQTISISNQPLRMWYRFILLSIVFFCLLYISQSMFNAVAYAIQIIGFICVIAYWNRFVMKKKHNSMLQQNLGVV